MYTMQNLLCTSTVAPATSRLPARSDGSDVCCRMFSSVVTALQDRRASFSGFVLVCMCVMVRAAQRSMLTVALLFDVASVRGVFTTLTPWPCEQDARFWGSVRVRVAMMLSSRGEIFFSNGRD